MSTPGFQEAQAKFGFDEAAIASVVGDVRRFGPHGPAYEVVSREANGDVGIIVIESGEQLTYPYLDYLADPKAETVP